MESVQDCEYVEEVQDEVRHTENELMCLNALHKQQKCVIDYLMLIYAYC